jgi:hypothetical protein
MKPMYYIATAIFGLAISTPAFAATHTITIKNPDGDRIVRFSAMHAKVIGFKPTNATEFDVTIDLPDDGICNPIVRVTMGTGERVESRIAICQDQGFTLRNK